MSVAEVETMPGAARWNTMRALDIGGFVALSGYAHELARQSGRADAILTDFLRRVARGECRLTQRGCGAVSASADYMAAVQKMEGVAR